MTSTLNTFEGGTGGSTITTGNSGGASGTAFNFVNIAATGSATFYATTPYRGSLCGRFASGGTAGLVYGEITTAMGTSSTGSVYGRMRVRLPVLPPDATGVRFAVITDSTGAFVGDFSINNAGKIRLRNSAGTQLAISTTTYVAGAWLDVGVAVLTFSATVGQSEIKIYDANGNVSETLTSAATVNTLGAGGSNKFQAGMIRSGVTSFAVDIDDLAWSTTGYPTTPVAPTLLYGPWSGAVTDAGFTAAFVVAGTALARMVVSTSAALTSPVYSSSVAPDADGVVKLTVGSLSAATQYYLGVECDGVLLATGRGEVKTFPTAGAAASFSLAFGSCQFTVPSDSTFAAILAKTGAAGGRALQIVHMGDMSYSDWSGAATAGQVFAQHMVSLGSVSMAGALAKIPLNYLWDNHDWGGDTSDKDAVAGTVVAAGYRKVFPAYPLPATDGRGGYHTWVIGRVRFIELDVRSYRNAQADPDNSSKSMLGTEQKAWFKARLLDAEPVKVICGNYPWRDDGAGSGRWGSYLNEFTELSDYIDAHVPGQVYAIFGDRHFLAADDGTGTGTRGIPQAGGAPFQQASVAVTDTWSAGSYTNSPSTVQAYGWLDVTDDGDLITVAYSGITSLDATTRVSMSTVFDTVVAGGTAVTLPAVTSVAAATSTAAGAAASVLAPAVAAASATAGVTAGAVTSGPRAAVLARARVVAEAGMADTCTIRRRTGETTDEANGTITPTWASLYAGKCRVQQAQAQAEPRDAGEAHLLLLRLEVQLPMSVTGLQVGDEVTITAAAYDADLPGRVFLVRDLAHKTDATARRVQVTERTS